MAVQQEIIRGIGLAVGFAGIGPARRAPALHRVLHDLGVLQRLPESWPDSPRLEPLPWGSKQFDHQPARLPAGLDGPWPQPPVIDRDFAAPVLDVPSEERQLHRRYNVLRYLGQISALSPIAAARALRGPRVAALDDQRLCELINETCFAQFICTELDADDRRDFAEIIAADKDSTTSWAKIDASAVAPVHALPGIHVAPTRTLLRFDGVVFRPVAIRFTAEPATTVRPDDGPAWSLARYFVLQALHYLLVLVFHPCLHFPPDAINAITRTMLPPGHVLAKLLRPHGRFTLGLHEAVIHHRRSVLHNSQRELYTPFPVTTEGIHAGVVIGMHGLAGNAAYPAYRFGPRLLDARISYGRYRRDWYAAVHAFVSRVLEQLDRDDPRVRNWADAICEWLPGFPDGEAIGHGDALAHAVTSYICDVSVFHSADHHSYAGIPLPEVPWRIRVPPPNLARPRTLELEALVSPEDSFRHQLCHAMFFAPVVIESLRGVRYDFGRPQLRTAHAEFQRTMDALDHRWAGSSFPSSREIATSLQY
jgi:hypothetical protein